MKKHPIILSLLALSLLANAWLLWSHGSRSTDTASSASASTAAPRASATAGRTSSAAQENTPQPYVWRATGTSNEALRDLASQLRAAGFPPDIVVRFVGEMLRERTYAATLALPYWQLLSPGKEARKIQSAAAYELLRLQEEILGPSGSQVATLDPLTRSARFGQLGDSKVSALLRIERDYDEMKSDLSSNMSSYSSEDVKARQDQFRAIEKERLADIAATLTPEEYADWERRQSGSAKSVMTALRGLTVSEDEYTALLTAQKARDPNGSNYGIMSFDESARNPATAYAFTDSVRSTLGDERASTYLKSTDFAYAQAANFVEKHPDIPAAKSFELYKIQTEAQALLMNSRSSTSGAISADSTANLKAGIAELNTRLDTLLGSANADAYRSQGTGSMLRAFNNTSAPKK